jgi:transcriptional regulator with XRE-family HTH domain
VIMLDTLGERSRAARRNKELTLDEFADVSGLSKGFLSDLENDKRNPSASTLINLSDALEVSVEWLIRGRRGKPMKCPYCKGKGNLD